MGARGPKPNNTTPIKLTPKERPKAPAHLTAGAKRAWRQIVNSLPVDRFRMSEAPLLAAYCSSIDIYWRALKQFREEGEIMVITLSNGVQSINPLLNIMNKQTQVQMSLATKLRLAPNSRLSNDGAGRERETPKSKRPQDLMFGGRNEPQKLSKDNQEEEE